MKVVKNLEELKRDLKDVHSGVASDTMLSVRGVVFIAEQLVGLRGDIQQLGKDIQRLKRTKRKPSAYNIFVGEQLKAGKSFTDAVKAWKKRGVA